MFIKLIFLKIPWTDKEVECLISYIQQYKQEGKKVSWKKISQVLKTKSPRQCYDFYLNHRDANDNITLHNAKRYHQWSKEEREKLKELTKNNIDWQKIKLAFPDFNINQLKNQIRQITQEEEEKQKSKKKNNSYKNEKQKQKVKQTKQEQDTQEQLDINVMMSSLKLLTSNQSLEQEKFDKNLSNILDPSRIEQQSQQSLQEQNISISKKPQHKSIQFYPIDGKDQDIISCSQSEVSFIDFW